MNLFKSIYLTTFVVLFSGLGFYSFAQGVKPNADKPFIVVIDPGHGGFDPGAHGRYSTEKEVALGIGLKTGKLIDQIPGVKVYYTRTTDICPGNKTNKTDGLHYRASFANKKKGNVFISIHCNSSRNHSAKGTEVYVWALRKNKSKGSFIRKSSDFKDSEMDNSSGDSDEGVLDAIFVNSMRHSYMKQSLTLASDIEKQFSKINRIDRSVKQRNEVGIWVLHATAMPSILIETGFISNPQEEDYLNHNQGEISESIYKAFVNYLAGLKGLNKKQLLAGARSPDHSTSSNKSDYHYSIQLFASSNKMNTNTRKFQKLEDIVSRKMIKNNENKTLYRYLLGDYKSFQDAAKKLKSVKPMGYKDAFIVVYKGNKRIDY